MILFVLYIIQVALGTLIHVRRPKHGRAHPPRNVVHVVLGLALFGLSIYEVCMPGSCLQDAVHSFTYHLFRYFLDREWHRSGSRSGQRQSDRSGRDMHRMGSG